MLLTHALAFLSLAAQQTPVADELDALIERSRAIRSFTATFDLTVSDRPEPMAVRMDYQAPDRVRLDSTGGGKTMSLTCSGGVLSVVSDLADPPIRGRVELGAVLDGLEPVERALREATGGEKRPRELRASVVALWSFDEKEKKANYVFDVTAIGAQETPLGWLLELRRKGGEPAVDGDLLRFTTDGEAFRVAIDRDTGFLSELDGRSPTGELHMERKTLQFDVEIEPARFTPPAAAPGARDVTPELTGSANRGAEALLRKRIYDAFAAEPAGEPWDEAKRAKIEPVLRAFHERAVPGTVDKWRRERADKVREGVAKRLRELAASGKTPEEVEKVRQREIGFLTEQLDQLEEGFRTRLAAPESRTPLPRSEELLALEKGIVVDVFRKLVREPLLSEFERATAPGK